MGRILHILPGLQPNDGISTVFMNYLQNIDHEMFQFDVICHWPFHPDYRDIVESFGGTVTYLPRISFHDVLSTTIKVNDYFKKHPKYDAVHCHMANSAFIYLPIAEKNHVALRIIHSHQDRYADSLSHAIRNAPLISVGKKFANCNVACSNSAGNFLFKNDDYYVLHNSIDTEKFSYSEDKRIAFRKQMGFNSKQLIFGSIGRLTAQKNQSFVLDIFKQLLLKYPDCKLLMIGEGALKDKLVEKANFLGISDSIKWLDNVIYMDLVYQGLDALLFPSLYEGLPLTLVEAQASGLPCFTSDQISKEALMTDRSFPLPIDNGAKTWSNTVESVLENAIFYESRSRYAQIVKRAGFDIHNTTDELARIYDFHSSSTSDYE